MLKTRLVIALLTGLLVAGCSSRSNDLPELAPVQGRILLNGIPLEFARVTFEPQQTGRPSFGRTDESGNFQLSYLRKYTGAVVGIHQVRISTSDQVEDRETGTRKLIPERVPPTYNTNSVLTANVQAGKNEIVFELTDSK